MCFFKSFPTMSDWPEYSTIRAELSSPPSIDNDLSGSDQGLARLRLDSQDRDWYLIISSLVVETETKTMTP